MPQARATSVRLTGPANVARLCSSDSAASSAWMPPGALVVRAARFRPGPAIVAARSFRCILTFALYAKYSIIRKTTSAKTASANCEGKRPMRVAVLGGGPAGLYFAYLWRKRHPASEVVLFEQNPAGATWGFGVVFSDRALDFLNADDPDTAGAIIPHMETWQDMTLVHRGRRVTIDGVGFSAIGRLDLLLHLQARMRSVGVTSRFDTVVRGLDELDGFDLIVAADGVNSLVRRSYEGDFKTQ